MTKQEAIENHRKMWRWIAEQTRIRKRIVSKNEYFDTFGIPYISTCCYCCEYAENTCSNCPIEWNRRYCMDSEYAKWLYADTWQEAAHWAEVIAELPERIEVNYNEKI
ncbi:MAG: hypothetical protein Q4G33_15440 [bacterium]|nr:hypothetical protein [bacterium]